VAAGFLKGFCWFACYIGHGAAFAQMTDADAFCMALDPLENLLERWRGAPPPLARDLRNDVAARIAAIPARPRWRDSLDWLFRPSFAIACGVAAVLFGLLLLEMHRSRVYAERNAELAHQYLQLIDPRAGGVATPGGRETELAWLRESLQLDAVQFAQIKALHEQSSPRLLALAFQVAQMRQEFAAFEDARKSTGEIDFLEFARFVENRRAVEKQCAESARQLVAAAADVMNPSQRETYFSLLPPTLAAVGTTN
jgi:hypothetical protein